jgi:magnesium transporter
VAEQSIPLTEFISGTASEHVRRLVPVTSPHTTARELRHSLEGVYFESATHIGGCDDGKLVGVFRVEELFSALPEDVVGEIMDADPPVVAPGVDQEKAAWKAVQHGEGDRLKVTGDWTPATAAGKRLMGRTITTWERAK